MYLCFYVDRFEYLTVPDKKFRANNDDGPGPVSKFKKIAGVEKVLKKSSVE